MTYQTITAAQVLLSDERNEIYMLVPVRGDLTLEQIRTAPGFVVEVEEDPEPVAVDAEEPKKGKKVDRDKVTSLVKAGWSVANIAQEMSCSEQTVRNIMKEVAWKDAES